MKPTIIFPSAILVIVLLAFLMMALPASPVFADDPTSLPAGLPWGKGTPWPAANPLTVGKPWTAQMPAPPAQSAAPVVPVPVVVATPAYVASPLIVPAPSVPVAVTSQHGNSPLDALLPNGDWQTLGAGATVWYRIGTANEGGVHMDVWLESSLTGGVDMAIYGPDQLNNLAGPPAGHGTRSKSDPARLNWSGGGSNRVSGNWFARVTNHNSVSARVRVTSEETLIAPKNDCASYWEYIGRDYVYWSACK